MRQSHRTYLNGIVPPCVVAQVYCAVCPPHSAINLRDYARGRANFSVTEQCSVESYLEQAGTPAIAFGPPERNALPTQPVLLSASVTLDHQALLDPLPTWT